ncbi:chymotrypsin-1-like [Octopus vulgaris]|uniref:Chymotrypsin-1-like n=1 Tax=Octopus vulgaris TaxID=6645 RepID=A0AA36F592_OCTVU|nr:chymotrypsin-1-like [Octopus vulgaris]
MLSLCCLLVTVASVFAAPAEQIVGGSPAANCEFPSIVHLTISDRPKGSMGITFANVCGGTLIDSTHVLTAAHCLERRNREVRVDIGSNHLSFPGPQSTNAIQNVTHEDFVHQPYLIQNDIAILTLSRPVREEGCVKFATMANQGETFDHKRCIAAGWGSLFFNGNSPNELYKVALPAIPHDVCKRRSGMRIAEGILCAGDFKPGGASVCKGDSGGPLYCPRSNGEMVLAGVTSFGYKCETDVSAFSDVGYFRNWIDRHT